jgi:hypothetical protein
MGSRYGLGRCGSALRRSAPAISTRRDPTLDSGSLIPHQAAEPDVRRSDPASRQPRIVDTGIPPSFLLSPSVVGHSGSVAACSLIVDSGAGRLDRARRSSASRSLLRRLGPGRRSSWASRCTSIDDAVEQLMGMRHTCALDIAAEYPDGITERSVGLALGISEKAARADIERAGGKLRAELFEPPRRDAASIPR